MKNIKESLCKKFGQKISLLHKYVSADLDNYFVF